MDATGTEDGRARSKRATRNALRAAVLALARDRGLAAVTVDEIAAHAGVSTRTFFNYFDTKEDAALIDVITLDREDLLAFAAEKDRGTAWVELSALVTANVDRAHRENPNLLQYLQLQADDRALQAHQVGRFSSSLHELTNAATQRLGQRVRNRLTAELMAGSSVTAVRVGLEQWAAGGGRGRPGTHVGRALAVFDPAFGPQS
ncbi:MAG: TetR/AcrR family transcriptional regulator [Mycobacterium sp.]